MSKKRFSKEYLEKLRQNRTEANKKLLTCPHCQQPISAINLKTHVKACLENPNFEGTSYVEYCFKFHRRKCVVCSERRCIEVHHFDRNRTNNSPGNLIPLCPTHHRYLHSKYAYLIEQKVLNYVDKFKKDLIVANDS